METPPQNVTVLDGKDATIFCRAAGAPVPNITWIYNGNVSYYVAQIQDLKLTSTDFRFI